MEFNLSACIAVLSRTPQVVTTLVGGLPSDLTQADYGPNTWSVHQIVGHLIWGERTDWMPRLRHILERGESAPFEPFDRNGHAGLCRKHGLDELLAMFAAERAACVQQLESLRLTDAHLQLRGRHPAFGVVTVSQLLATWMVHDFNHIAQISKAIAFQQKAAVGPWEQYLSILSPPNPR